MYAPVPARLSTAQDRMCAARCIHPKETTRACARVVSPSFSATGEGLGDPDRGLLFLFAAVVDESLDCRRTLCVLPIQE